MAAYRAIMSRMIPFSNHINGHGLSKRFVKHESVLVHDETSDDDDDDDADDHDHDESSSQSPMNDRLSS
jgi:hypothetical protein